MLSQNATNPKTPPMLCIIVVECEFRSSVGLGGLDRQFKKAANASRSTATGLPAQYRDG